MASKRNQIREILEAVSRVVRSRGTPASSAPSAGLTCNEVKVLRYNTRVVILLTCYEVEFLLNTFTCNKLVLSKVTRLFTLLLLFTSQYIFDTFFAKLLLPVALRHQRHFINCA